MSTSFHCHIDGKIQYTWQNDFWSDCVNECGHYIDNLISKEYKDELLKSSQLLINDKRKLNHHNLDLINKESSIHFQIQDLIDPCHHNESYNDGFKVDVQDEMTESVNFIPTINIEDDEYASTRNTKNPYIPTVFELNAETNTYEIKSDINGLSRQEYPKLYNVIQNIFTKMIPNMHRTLSILDYTSSKFGSEDEEKAKFFEIELNNKYYAIVHAADYQFMHPLKSSYDGEPFARKGFASEYIKSVGLYYFDISDNIDPGNLCFRRLNGSYGDREVTIQDGRCIFVCNDTDCRHKQGRMKIKSRDDASQLQFIQPFGHEMHPWQEFVRVPSTDSTYTRDSKPFYQDKYNRNVFGTMKSIGFFVIDPDKCELIKTTKELIVNLESKVPFIVGRWLRDIDKCINHDLVQLVVAFCSGDIEYIRTKTNENREKKVETSG